MKKVERLKFDLPKEVEQIHIPSVEVLPVQKISMASIEKMPERKMEEVIPIKV